MRRSPGFAASLAIIVIHQKGHFHHLRWEALGKSKISTRLDPSTSQHPNLQGTTQHSDKGRMDAPAPGAFIALLLGFYSRLPPRLGGMPAGFPGLSKHGLWKRSERET